LPDFSRFNVPKLGKKYQIATKSPNGYKMYQMAVSYSEWPKNIPTFFIIRPWKIYPNLYFWFEKKPSGNPGSRNRILLLPFKDQLFFFSAI
jgi:hypothetical protein